MLTYIKTKLTEVHKIPHSVNIARVLARKPFKEKGHSTRSVSRKCSNPSLPRPCWALSRRGKFRRRNRSSMRTCPSQAKFIGTVCWKWQTGPVYPPSPLQAQCHRERRVGKRICVCVCVRSGRVIKLTSHPPPFEQLFEPRRKQQQIEPQGRRHRERSAAASRLEHN